MNRRFNRDMERLESYKPLGDYFGIYEDPNTTVTIDYLNISKNSKHGIILDISYHKKYSYFSFPDLPVEINDLIYSFNFYLIKIKCILQFPIDYTFKPIKWGLLSVKNNINKTNLNEYYKTMVWEHNKKNKENLQPATQIHHNILNFITEINDFESIINSVY